MRKELQALAWAKQRVDNAKELKAEQAVALECVEEWCVYNLLSKEIRDLEKRQREARGRLLVAALDDYQSQEGGYSTLMVDGSVKIVNRKVVSIDEGMGLRWAISHGVCLKLDVAAMKQLAKLPDAALKAMGLEGIAETFEVSSGQIVSKVLEQAVKELEGDESG